MVSSALFYLHFVLDLQLVCSVDSGQFDIVLTAATSSIIMSSTWCYGRCIFPDKGASLNHNDIQTNSN